MRIDTSILLVTIISAALCGCSKDSDKTSATPAAEATPASQPAKPTPLDPPSAAQSAPAVPSCTDCGTVVGIKQVKVAGDNSGMGAVIGAAVGGMLGHQLGGGRGQDATTAAGVIGGALAGNAIEKNRNAKTAYAVTVQMDNGNRQTVTVANADNIEVGTDVEVVGNNLRLRQSSS